MIENAIYHLLDMTVDDWLRNPSYNIPFEVKRGFVYFAGYVERWLTEKYEYKNEWVMNDDVFMRIFNDSPIDENHRKISLRVSFHRNFIEVCYEGVMICNMYISTAKAPVVGFRSVTDAWYKTRAWDEVHKIQEAFGHLFRNTFKEENIHE